MAKTGYADLPLHYGHVPSWLAQRMSKLGGAIVETIVMDYGKSEVLKRLSDPFWFQALGCVMGMDWHSSGITTSVMGALKKAINPMANELGIFICGGKGKHSRQTPMELLSVAEKTGIDAQSLIRSSKLSAKVDNTTIQDGFQLYLHSFIVTNEGEWAVVQQGMNQATGLARRYHWHSPTVKSYIETPHAFIYGKNQGEILNLTAKEANITRSSVLTIVQEEHEKMFSEIKRLVMPNQHNLTANDVNLKRLGSILALAYEKEVKDFESLILLEGLGPRTLQSLVLVSEVIHGTPSRFSDPARFSFAHGGKDGHPFPVPLKVYDETLHILTDAIQKAKIGFSDKQKAIKNLSKVAAEIEKDFTPNTNFDRVIAQERKNSYQYGGMTVFGKATPLKKGKRPSKQRPNNGQLDLFEQH